MSIEESWTGRESLLTATRHHVLARFSPGGEDIIGYQRDSTVLWKVGRRGTALGDPVDAASIGAGLALLVEFGICLLGVVGHNTRAQAIFDHLGYRTRMERTTVPLRRAST